MEKNYNNTNLKFDKEKVDWRSFWHEAYRVCKETAVMALFACGSFTPKLIQSNPKDYRYELIWEKKVAVGFLDAKRRPLRAHENILIFARRPRQTVYNPQMLRGRVHARGSLGSKPAHYSGACRTTPSVKTDTYYPRSVLRFDGAAKRSDGRSYHPTCKPLDLLEWLIQTYSNAGDLVLDPFAGSGTTIVAAKMHGRRALGIEIDRDYYNVACERLAEATEVLQ